MNQSTQLTHKLEHLLIIPDGNGRWASQRRLAREEGHMAGIQHVPALIDECLRQHIRYVSIFVFSTENWQRPLSEVSGIFRAIAHMFSENLQAWHAQGIQICHVGRTDQLPSSLQTYIQQASNLTASNTTLTLSFVLDYGSRADIVAAIQRLLRSGLPSEQITDQVVSAHLSTSHLPDPDLIIRTGNRFRISNLFLWEIQYSEFWFSDLLWPDFRVEHLQEALQEFHQRTRTWGKAPSTVLADSLGAHC
jgi:undecaprenyl diphosphate synthase